MMMWLHSLLVLMSIGGYLCQNDGAEISCYGREMTKCQETISLPSEYPQTPEDLMAACQTIISMQNCTLEIKKNCDDVPDSEEFRNYPRSLDYLKSTCQEDNPTFKAVASNLPCVERVLKLQDWRHCFYFFSSCHQDIIVTAKLLLSEGSLISQRARCVNDLLDVTCQGVIFGYHCGEEMKEAAEEIKAHLHSPDYLECSAEQLEEMSLFRKIFEGLLVEEMELGNNLKIQK